MRILGYARSTKGKNQGASIERQKRFIIEFCQKKSHELVTIYIDEGCSGKIPMQKRPQGKLLLEHASRENLTIAVTKIAKLTQDRRAADFPEQFDVILVRDEPKKLQAQANVNNIKSCFETVLGVGGDFYFALSANYPDFIEEVAQLVEKGRGTIEIDALLGLINQWKDTFERDLEAMFPVETEPEEENPTGTMPDRE